MSHAIERAKERYGLDLTNEDLAAIHALCTAKAKVRSHESGSGEYLVKYQGTIMMVVVEGPTVITFLSLDALEKGNRRQHRFGRSVKKKPRRKKWRHWT